MAISVPPYMPIAPRQRPNIDIAGSIGGLGDALIGGLEYGTKRKADRATKAAFQEPVYNADGTMNYAAMAGKIAQGGGDIETALTLTRLAEVQAQNAWQRGQPDWQVINGSLYNLRDLGGQGGGQQGGEQPAYPPSDSGGQPAPDLGGGGGYPPEPDLEQQAAAGQPEPVIRGPEPQRPRRRGLNAAGQEVDQEWTGSEWVDVSGPKAPTPKSLSATDRKAIQEADDLVMAGENTVNMLDQALTLNEQALSGPMAEQRGYAGSVLPDWAAPGSRQSAVATEQLNNLVTAQALESLRSTFGSMPTEGERKILLEIQGSVNQSADVRRSIYQRAQQLARKRLEFNRQRANELRAGTYYTEQEGLIAQPAATEAAPAEISPDNPVSPEPQGEIIEQGGHRYMIAPNGDVIQLD